MRATLILISILALFALVLCLLPLDGAVQIGADEGYELAKATLSLHGYKMYTEVWNDQPPLHTFLITAILKHVSPSIAGPRLLSSGFAMVLLASFFYIGLRISGLAVATISTTLLLASPIFLELGSSCMVEIPAMAPAVAAIALLLSWRDHVLPVTGIGHNIESRERARTGSSLFLAMPAEKCIPWARITVAGLLLGISFQIKFINVVLLPLISLVLWVRFRCDKNPLRKGLLSLSYLAGTCGVTFFLINQLVDGQGFLVQFRQSWSAHFASAQSFEYSSPADHPFDWRILVRNWDAAIPGIIGVLVIIGSMRQRALALVAGVWLVVNLSVFAIHKPWWSCYYLHIAVPLSLCGGIGVVASWKWVRSKTVKGRLLLVGLYACAASIWAVGRVCIEVLNVRTCPQTHACLFLEDIARFKPHVQWIYTEEPIYSFHAGIPMPPEFAVVALKRLWSGDMTNAKIASRLREIKPGLLLLSNDARMLPFSDLVAAEYQLAYQDKDYRLLVLKSVAARAKEKQLQNTRHQ